MKPAKMQAQPLPPNPLGHVNVKLGPHKQTLDEQAEKQETTPTELARKFILRGLGIK